MKCVLLISFSLMVIANGLSEEFIQQLKHKAMEVGAICVPQSGANEGDIAEIKNKIPPTRKEGKCLLSCFYKNFGMQTEDGAPNQEGLFQLLEPIRGDDPEFYAKMKTIATKCGPYVSQMGLTDHCDVAAEMSACVMAEGKLVGIDDSLGMRS